MLLEAWSRPVWQEESLPAFPLGREASRCARCKAILRDIIESMVGCLPAAPLGQCHSSLPWAPEVFLWCVLAEFPAVWDGVEMELLGVLLPPGMFRAVILWSVY